MTLAAVGLRKSYGKVVALDGVDLTVERGQIVGFLGPNGSGKTTTMRAIMQLVDLDSGSVTWAGHPIDERTRARFGYMPAERGMYPRMRVHEQLVYYGRLSGMSASEASAASENWLKRLGLEDRADSDVQDLSSGNQQRVQLALALLSEPEVLVLDEPFSGLDPLAAASLSEIVQDAARAGRTVLFSSHQLDLVDRLCDSLVVLSDGRVMAAGTSEELRSRGPRRHRIATEPDAGWLRDEPGVTVLDVDGPTAVIEVADGAHERLLSRAVSHGLTEFTPLQPSLSDIYREVTR
jgi:ABC-2 type transport system ATP-binding protein